MILRQGSGASYDHVAGSRVCIKHIDILTILKLGELFHDIVAD